MLLLHFLPFMKELTENAFMYAANSVTNTFYYTIPALLNASLVLLFAGRDYIGKANIRQIFREPKLRYSILLLVIYLAINSDMFQSILLIAYIASVLMIYMIDDIKGEVKLFLMFCRKNIIWLGVIIIWLLSLLMESQGGRATDVQFSGSFLLAVGEIIKVLVDTVKGLNHLFVLMFVVIEGFAVILFLFSKRTRTDRDKEYMRLTMIYFISLLITVAYLVLVCARVGAHYFRRSDVFQGSYFMQ